MIKDARSENSIETYQKKYNELLNLIKNNKEINSEPIHDLFNEKKVRGAVIGWAKRNPNMKVILMKSRVNDRGLWEEDFDVVVDNMFSAAGKTHNAPLFKINEGAFTEREISEISKGVCLLFEQGNLPICLYVYFWFSLILGLRQSQLLKIKCKDFTYKEMECMYYLKIEKIKQRGSAKNEIRSIRLPPLLNELTKYHLQKCKLRNRTYIFHESGTNKQGIEMPDEEIKSLKDTQLNSSLLTGLNLRLANRGVVCERDVKKRPYVVNNIRFKHTMLTRAAINGATAFELAELAMHSNLESVQYYIDAIPEARAAVRESVGPILKSIAMRFTNTFYEGGYMEAVEKLPNQIKRHYGIDKGKPVGVCGANINCMLNAPIACLTCVKFEPFTDAPFDEIKDFLVESKEGESDLRIAGIYDEYIEACDIWSQKRQEITL